MNIKSLKNKLFSLLVICVISTNINFGFALPSQSTTNPTEKEHQTVTQSIYGSTSIEYCKLSGYIKPEFSSLLDNDIRSGFFINIMGTEYWSTTDKAGYFEITNIPQTYSVYDIVVKKYGYLERSLKSIQFIGDIIISSADVPIDMYAGDIPINGINDKSINMSDVMKVAQHFNSVKGRSNYTYSCDINNDGAINLTDIMVILRNFNKTSNDYPEYDTPKKLSILKFGSLNNYLGSMTTEFLDPYTCQYAPRLDMSINRYNPACESIGEDCYVVGGVYKTSNQYSYVNNIDVYSLKNNKWITKGFLNIGREAPGICSYLDKIYIIGGMTDSAYPHITDSAEVFSLDNSKTDFIPNMLEARWFPLCLQSDGYIYCLGGVIREEGINKTTKTLQIFDIDKNQWFYGPAMISNEGIWGGVVYSNNIYIVKDSSIEIYNISKREWTSVPNTSGINKTEDVLAAEGKGGKLFCVFSDSVRVYNPHNNQWTILANTSTDDTNFGLGIVCNTK
ncbi:MAG TPA: dockerin type I domain-containing protein [Pseudobacteroides sp.]|uniref:dockerin type I domain-containing protein n=1 Tax=Pseudobacteroides sp. TaxID=1968840 RepID=UPI002F930CE0